ncbi:MAG TPA: type 1 glutamine amidotransferase domain-containing protein [Pirellulales bacterium]|nr:type 1 glutamine amidotransferase domain-containing protein [Pirellulales bacterium]
MSNELKGKKVAILVAKGFEEVELTEPKRALEEAGAETKIVSPERGVVRGWNFTDWSESIPVDIPLDDADAGDFDALVLPGGVMNPDQLRQIEKAVELVKEFFVEGKPVGAICHAPWTLIEAGVVAGRTMTSYPSLRTDLRNAGANWVDKEVVVDNGLVTSRDPNDLKAFCAMLIDEIREVARTR